MKQAIDEDNITEVGRILKEDKDAFVEIELVGHRYKITPLHYAVKVGKLAAFKRILKIAKCMGASGALSLAVEVLISEKVCPISFEPITGEIPSGGLYRDKTGNLFFRDSIFGVVSRVGHRKAAKNPLTREPLDPIELNIMPAAMNVLEYTVYYDQLEMLKILMDDWKTERVRRMNSTSLARLALYLNKNEIAKVLLPNINEKDECVIGRGLVFSAEKCLSVNAVLSDNREGLELLVNHGFSVAHEEWVMSIACNKGYIDCVSYLIKQGTLAGCQAESVLVYCQEAGIRSMFYILTRGITDKHIEKNRDCLSAKQEADAEGVHIYIDAVKFRGEAEVRAMSEWMGVDADLKSGYTALMIAARMGRSNIVQLLLDLGADVTKEVDGVHALLIAIKDSFSCARVLLRNKAVKDAVSKGLFGDITLFIALRVGVFPVIKALVEAVENINGANVLQWVCAESTPEVVNYFVTRPECAADINRIAESGEFPLKSAAARNLGSVKPLLNAGAEVNLQDENGVSALLAAVESGAGLTVIQWLLDAGADPILEDNQGRSAFSLAFDAVKDSGCDPKYLEVVGVLRQGLKFSR